MALITFVSDQLLLPLDAGGLQLLWQKIVDPF